MKNPNDEKKTPIGAVWDALWDEMTGPPYSSPPPKFSTVNPPPATEFLGRVSSVTFRRHHPLDSPAGPQATNDSIQPER